MELRIAAHHDVDHELPGCGVKSAGVAQSWRKVGFTEVSFTEDETLVVANTMPAFRAAPDGSRPFLNSASLPLALPPGVDAEGFWTVRLQGVW